LIEGLSETDAISIPLNENGLNFIYNNFSYGIAHKYEP